MIRSGIWAQNPGHGRGGGPSLDLVRDLLRKAQEEGAIWVLQRGTRSAGRAARARMCLGRARRSRVRPLIPFFPSFHLRIVVIVGAQTNSPSTAWPYGATFTHALRPSRQRVSRCAPAKYMPPPPFHPFLSSALPPYRSAEAFRLSVLHCLVLTPTSLAASPSILTVRRHGRVDVQFGAAERRLSASTRRREARSRTRRALKRTRRSQ
ncbi:hypothetical protein DFH08DRAFT_967384 [Mycena albidolilacea]|uniref:Uncharacterized protein n=1 Tax=Mycena albidolilacea TaxID=1033008 RepID=A0AAD6ZMG0_9AGAR|nr:hypothetical protein DFH08DRAFT_967384 [Mycena albidolilacea]